jgi:membrane protease YdiL (CAAX protease family)
MIGPETQPRSRRRDLVELLVGYALILGVIWTPRPWQRVLYVAAVIYLAVVIWRGFESWRAMGFRRENLGRSAWVVGLAAVLAAGFVSLGESRGWTHRGHTARWFLGTYWGYAIWALVQQVLLQDFFLGRVLRLMRGGKAAAVWVAAGVFALAHLPNPILAPMTLVWGAVSCAVFLRYRNIWTLATAHALLGITLSVTMPRPVVRSMRVGLGWLRYHRPVELPMLRALMDRNDSTAISLRGLSSQLEEADSLRE